MSLPAFPGNQQPENLCCAWEHQCQEVWGCCPASGVGTPSWEPAPEQHPSISVSAQSFLQEHLQAPGSATLGTRWIDLPPRELRGWKSFQGLWCFSLLPLGKAGPVGGRAGYQWHWDIPGASRGTRTSRAVTLLCFHSLFTSIVRRCHSWKWSSAPLRGDILENTRWFADSTTEQYCFTTKKSHWPTHSRSGAAPEKRQALHPIRAARRKLDRVFIKSSSVNA